MVEKVPTIAAGVPEGGTTGQVLAKASNTNNDVVWVPASGIAAPANPGDNGKALVASAGTYSWQILGPAGGGAPAGGSANQVLKKNSGTNYDYSWGTAPGAAPVAGTTGQVLTKTSGSDYAYNWQTPIVSGWNRIFVANGTGYHGLGTLNALKSVFSYPDSNYQTMRFKIRWSGLYGRSVTTDTVLQLRLWYLAGASSTAATAIGLLPSLSASANGYRAECEMTITLNAYRLSGTPSNFRYLVRVVGSPDGAGNPFSSNYFVTINSVPSGGFLSGISIESATAGNEPDGGLVEVFVHT